MTKLEEVEARLRGLSPLPWSTSLATASGFQDDLLFNADDGKVVVGAFGQQASGKHFVVTAACSREAFHDLEDPDAQSDADAEFVAAAPEDVRWLVERVRKLEAAIRAHRGSTEGRDMASLAGSGSDQGRSQTHARHWDRSLWQILEDK